MLFTDIPSSVVLDYSFAFNSKMASFEIMYRKALKKARNLAIITKKEKSEDKIAMPMTTKAWYEAIAFFEAYLNSFYSLLQIIAKFTPLFYEENKDKIPTWNFGLQKKFFVDRPKFDADFSSYLIHKLGWYETLRGNRHAITHNLSAFLGFDEDGKVVFRDYPKSKQSFRQIEKYLNQSFNDMLNFLEFYTQHFRKRVPKSDRTKLMLRSIFQENPEQ
jgi:hypothetical protein